MRTLVVAKSVLLRPDGKLLLVRRHRASHNRPGQWDLPGGKIDDGETYAEGAAREIEEEAALSVRPDGLRLVYAATSTRGAESIIRLFYVGDVGQDTVRLNGEHEEFVWLTLDEAIEVHDYQLHRQLLEYIRDNNLLADLALARTVRHQR